MPPWKVAVLTNGLPVTARIKQKLFEKLAEEPQKHMTLAEFEAERERYIKDLERREAHGGD